MWYFKFLVLNAYVRKIESMYFNLKLMLYKYSASKIKDTLNININFFSILECLFESNELK